MPAAQGKPGPVPTAISKEFWEAARERRLVAQYCTHCQRYEYYPKSVCTKCWCSELEWRTLAGTGTIYTFTIVRRGPSKDFSDTPYAVGLIDLDEGIRMMSAITATDLEALQVGNRVQVRFESRGEMLVPMFERVG